MWKCLVLSCESRAGENTHVIHREKLGGRAGTAGCRCTKVSSKGSLPSRAETLRICVDLTVLSISGKYTKVRICQIEVKYLREDASS